MPATATIVNKGIQLVFSREEAVNLAQTGTATVRVKDKAMTHFGRVDVAISPLARAAILEHLDLPIPKQIMTDAQVEQERIKRGGV